MARKQNKEIKSISFDPEVVEKLELRSREDKISVSNLVNSFMRQIVLEDKEYYKRRAKEHCALMNHYKVLAEGMFD